MFFTERKERKMVVEIYENGPKKGKKVLKSEKVLIGEKEVKLKFTMPVWIQMEEDICVLDDLYTKLHEAGRLTTTVPQLVELMTDGEITAKEVRREKDPATVKRLIDMISEVAAKAITMRERKYEDDSVHDETLEEIEKKEPRAD